MQSRDVSGKPLSESARLLLIFIFCPPPKGRGLDHCQLWFDGLSLKADRVRPWRCDASNLLCSSSLLTPAEGPWLRPLPAVPCHLVMARLHGLSLKADRVRAMAVAEGPCFSRTPGAARATWRGLWRQSPFPSGFNSQDKAFQRRSESGAAAPLSVDRR